MQKRLLAFLDAVESQANSAGQFVIEQTPLVAQEYLAWTFWHGCLMAAVASIPLAIGLYLLRRFLRDPDGDAAPPLFVLALFGSIFGLSAAFYGIHSAVKVTVAPRVVLLEKVAELAD